MDCEPATEYGQLIVQMKDGRTHLYRVRLYDGHNYNWITHLISPRTGKLQLHTITDQVWDLEATANYTTDIDRFTKVWFNGVLIYKRPWYKFW